MTVKILRCNIPLHIFIYVGLSDIEGPDKIGWSQEDRHDCLSQGLCVLIYSFFPVIQPAGNE
jgi:hypothetical protein